MSVCLMCRSDAREQMEVAASEGFVSLGLHRARAPASILRLPINRNARAMCRAHNGTMELLSIGLHKRS